MTFAGRNFDILSGITAPIVYFVCFKNSQLKNRRLLLVWNFICLGLLLNIVINALLSAPFPFQQFAFDQRNIAILYFPFTWLPCFIVMIVLYSHLAAIRQLDTRSQGRNKFFSLRSLLCFPWIFVISVSPWSVFTTEKRHGHKESTRVHPLRI